MVSALVKEQWSEYGIGMAVFTLRFFARFKVVGFNGMKWDDLFCFFAMIFWTMDCALVQVITNYGSFVGLNAESAELLTDSQAASLEIGSKALFGAWFSYVSLIWSLKATILFFYHRLTLGLWQQKVVKVMGIACILAYIALVLELFGHCTPIQRNWQIRPYAGNHCTLTVTNYIMTASLNVLTDIGILSIPIPLLWKVRLPLSRKIVIVLLLSSGIFVITAALLRCILTLQDVSQINNSTIWAIRETFVSLMAISAPAIKPLFNKKNWLHSSSAHSKHVSELGFNRFPGSGKHTAGNSTVTTTIKGGNDYLDVEMGDRYKERESLTDMELKELSRNGSEESILSDPPESKGGCKVAPLKINVSTVYAIGEDSPRTGDLRGGREEKVRQGSVPRNPFRDPERRREREREGGEEWSAREGVTMTEVSVGKRQGEPSKGKAGKMLGL